MYAANQMCPIDQISRSCIFLAAIPNSNNYLGMNLVIHIQETQTHPIFQGKFQYTEGGCVCVKSSKLMY